jgi:hypothetical protein
MARITDLKYIFVMDTFSSIVETLKTGGPWAIIAVMGWVIRHLYTQRDSDRTKHDDEKQKLNDRLIAMAEKQNEIFEKASDNQTLLLAALERRHKP